MRGRYDVKEDEVPKKLVSVANKIEEIWEEHYRSYKKYSLISEILHKFEKRNKTCKVTYFGPRAISTKMKKWFGWKKYRVSENEVIYQYRMRWYGGYVYVIEFLCRDKKKKLCRNKKKK